MIYLLLLTLLAAVMLGPQIWVKHILKRHEKTREDLKGTGGEFAQHLIKRFELEKVSLEATEQGDHYDPISRTVRLSPQYLSGQSLAAVTVAAHEVGHAIQHQQKHALLLWRLRLEPTVGLIEKAGAAMAMMAPIATAIIKSPQVGFIMLIIAIISMAARLGMHLITLPVEIDASFNKALPILSDGNYLEEKDLKSIKRILTACAMTYVAQSLMGLLNIWRWLTLLKR